MNARFTFKTNRSIGWVAITLIVATSMLLSACNFSISQPTVDPNVISSLVYATAQARLTQDAFQTVAVQLTQAVASTATQGNQPADTQAVQATATTAPSATSAPSATLVPPTLTSAPTKTPTATQVPPTPTLTPRPKPVDWVEFVSDVSVPDGTQFSPASTFTKTWRLKNVGSSTWTKDYALVYTSGESMGAQKVINLTANVLPGAQVDLSANMVAPANLGSYEGDWMLRNASGNLFGISADASKAFWVKITVVKADTLVYDFTANYCATGVTWFNGTSTTALPCPGTLGSATGDVLKVDKPSLETGAIDNEPALRVEPQRVDNGVIKGTYPAVAILSGYHLKTVIGCWADTTGCDVVFSIHYKVDNGAEISLASYEEKYDKIFRKIDIDLSALAGKNVIFIFKIAAKGTTNANDSGHWLFPRIVK